MDPEIEVQVKEEIKQFIYALLYQMRDIAGEFPSKIRIDVFFPRNEGANMHLIECERWFGKEYVAEAEKVFTEHKKKKLVEEASNILKGTDH